MKVEQGAHAEKHRHEILEKGDLLVGQPQGCEALVVVRAVRREEPLSFQHPPRECEHRIAENPAEKQNGHEERYAATGADHGECGEDETDEGASRIPHEYPGGGKIVTEKTE